MTKWIIGHHKQPVILVDWSDLSASRDYHLLRASIPIGGRALTVYDEVYPQKKQANAQVETRFLKRLKELLADNCRPIIITDAGYRTPWFNAVTALGWDFVGRVGGHTMISPQGENDWSRIDGSSKTK